MATSRLIQPGHWVQIGPYWLRLKVDALNSGIVVPVTAHPGPLWVDVNRTVPGFRLQWGPPEDDEDQGEPELARPYVNDIPPRCGSCGAPAGRPHGPLCDRLREINRADIRRAMEAGTA